MINNFISKRLRSSILWFGTITAILSSVYVWYRWSEWGVVGIVMAPVIMLSSLFFWWLLIVYPQRASIVRGVLAGIMGFIGGLVLFAMSLITWTILIRVPYNLPIILSLLIDGLIVFAVIIPLGYLCFLAGGLLVGCLCRTIVPKVTRQHTVVLRLLAAGLLIALAWFIGLRESILFLIWGAPGGLLAWYLRRMMLTKANSDQQAQEPLQQTLQIMH